MSEAVPLIMAQSWPWGSQTAGNIISKVSKVVINKDKVSSPLLFEIRGNAKEKKLPENYWKSLGKVLENFFGWKIFLLRFRNTMKKCSHVVFRDLIFV